MLLADWTEGDGQREIIIDSDFHRGVQQSAKMMSMSLYALCGGFNFRQRI
ncbi:hypothetical protein [Raoultella ornithinolytica]|nr:hypothetical protein [Raoultella ornithinolytica]ELT0601170.1 hypothetical protein [Raoultella ornithinolytica]ELT0731743.1 hypothetical protein [Raoultella ornithinolytica]MCZ0876785.1 hypothetical protein [Raoultella ornithinolytica]MDS0889486.1 hypothetical protein [Raoultella ornithinolytica]MEB7859563.1 hypothetical protein [Raoultella ornithinolytica]